MDHSAAIVRHFRRRHGPLAVLLHGSRAAGMHRSHSDWDILLVVAEMPPVSEGREQIAGQDVEWEAIEVPDSEAGLRRAVGPTLQCGKVLWEDESRSGTRVLEQAAAMYAKGVHVGEAERASYRQFLEHKVAGMVDDLDTPYLFLRHQYVFFLRACNWWFELRGEFSKPFYLAMPAIRERDPECHELLLAVSSAASNADKVAAARRVVSRLFG